MCRYFLHGGENVSKRMNFLCSLQAITEIEKTMDAPESASPPAESSESCEEILFNPNVFTEFKLAGSAEVSLRLCDCLFYCSPGFRGISHDMSSILFPGDNNRRRKCEESQFVSY